MQQRLECPICESRFEIDSESTSETSTCPECNREFKTRQAIVPDEIKPKRENLILPEQVLKNTSAQNPEREAEDSKNESMRSVPLNENTTGNSDSTDAEQLVRRSRHKFTQKPRRIVPLIVMLLLAVIAGGLLAYLPYALKTGERLSVDQTANEDADANGPKQPQVEGDQNDNLNGEEGTTVETGPADVSELLGNIDDVTTNRSANLDPPRKKRKPKPAPPGKKEFFTQKQFDDCWRENQARIVRLEITNALGSHLALGTIVDSRGWIVTSFRSVAGASKIRVIQTTRSYEQFESKEPLSDLCKGVLMTDPAHDLAVLSINRRFVIEISDLNIAAEDQVLGTDKFLQFCFLQDNMPITLRETQVSGRAVFSDLSQDAQGFFDKTFLNGKDLKWIQHINLEGAVPGAPLFSKTGELVGINTENPPGQTSFAVSTEPLAKLIKEIPFDTKTEGGKSPLSLKTLSDELEKVGLEDRDQKMAVDEASPNRETSVAFNLAAKKCSAFDWRPKTESQYADLQEFARQLIELNTYAVQLATDKDAPNFHREQRDREKLETQIKNWQDEMLSILSSKPPRTEETMLELNKLSGEAIETTDLNQQDNAFHVAYVNVRLTALDSPRRADGIETITLELTGFDRFISVPYDDRFPTMLPESKWLSIFVITENGDLQFKHPVTNEIHEAKIAEMLMIQGPLK